MNDQYGVTIIDTSEQTTHRYLIWINSRAGSCGLEWVDGNLVVCGDLPESDPYRQRMAEIARLYNELAEDLRSDLSPE